MAEPKKAPDQAEAPPAREPVKLAELPLSSRTTTLDDPLTTSLLAEVARRSRTIDVSPEQIAEAKEVVAAKDSDSDDRDAER